MHKDFDVWNEKKKKIHGEKPNVFYHEREVWWCSLGVNVGFEQDGKGEDFARPVLIVKGFSREVFLCLPLTTRSKKGKHYHDIELGDGIVRTVILSQIRFIDSKRLKLKIVTINREQFDKIKRAFIKLVE